MAKSTFQQFFNIPPHFSGVNFSNRLEEMSSISEDRSLEGQVQAGQY